MPDELPDPPPETAQRIYDEALRARTLQDGRLDAIRGRGALLVTVATVAGAIFVAQDSLNGGWAIAAGVAYLGLFGSVAWLYWPHTWQESPNVNDLVTYYSDAKTDRPDTAVLHRDLAIIHYAFWNQNEDTLRKTKPALLVAIVSVGLLVACLAISRSTTNDQPTPAADTTADATADAP